MLTFFINQISKSMKVIRQFLTKAGILLFLLFMAAGTIHATPTFTCDMRNDYLVSANVFEFDVYLLNTSAETFELANIQWGINVPATFRGTGTITMSLVAGTSELNSSQIPTPAKLSFSNAKNVFIMTAMANPGSGSGSIISATSPGTRVGRFRFTNTVAFGAVCPMSLTWCFSASSCGYPTKVSAYVGGLATDITSFGTFTNSNLHNPCFTPVTTYSVTGGGTVCPGGTLPVGLGGSETGVTYTVTPCSSGCTQPGTGTSISFGSFGVGTYTVSAARNFTYITGSMTGSAAIIAKPAPGSASPITGNGGNHHVTEGTSGVSFGSAASSNADSYVWSYSGTGATINFNGNQNITVDFAMGATSGQLSVHGLNCGSVVGPDSFFDIFIDLSGPTVFDVTGPSGSYCAGTGGLPVGMANSQVGASYELYQDGGHMVPPVTHAGTGAAFSFGNQFGTHTYTVWATLGGVTAQMNGSIVITELPWITPTFAQLGPYCVNDVPGTLPGTSIEGYAGTWNPAVISTATAGSVIYTFTPNPGQGCITTATMTVIVNPWITPTFAQLGPYCVGDVPASLPGTSIEGYAGTWNPAVISTTTAGSAVYTFTPNPGQGCITTATMTVYVNAWITPVFYQMGPYCVNDVPGTLPGVSNNGIAGTWNPAVINTAAAGSTVYTFTPNPGQGCVTGASMTIVVNAWVTPTFAQLGPYCVNDVPGTLPGTSIEGYTGTWNPAVISTAAAGSTVYTFTPDGGQGCITVASMTVVVNAWHTPTFAQLGPYCVNDVPGTLPGTSIEGYTGTWYPPVISTATAGSSNYIFTPDAGQGCITGATMTIVVNPWVTPTFVQLGPYCQGATPGLLPGSSIEGYTGTWNPAVISTVAAGTTTYTFTPDAGQGCVTGATMDVVVDPSQTLTVSISGQELICCGSASPEMIIPNTNYPVGGYHWFLNGVEVSQGSTYYFIPQCGDELYVVVDVIMTQGCWTAPSAESNHLHFVGAQTSLTWTGAVSDDWGVAGNWNPAGIPACCTDVLIPAGLTNYPTVYNGGSCHNITIKMGATLIDHCLLTICGTANVERCYTKNTFDWHLIGSPIQNAVSGLFSGRYLQDFNEATSLYTDIASTTVPLNVMQGYAMWCNATCDGCVTFVGQLNMCNISHDLMFTDLGHGWNLLSNPFVASIDFDLQDIPSAMGPTVWYLDAASGNYLWHVKNGGGTGSEFIPPTQGFFVRAYDVGGVLTISDAYKSHVNGGAYYKSDNANMVIIEANGNDFKDQAWINFNEQTSAGFDMNNDVDKIVSISNPLLPQIFTTMTDGRKLAMNSLPQTTTVPMSFTAVQSGTFTINAVQTGACTKVVLEDLFKGTFTDLMTSSYTFDYTAGDAEGRFLLHFNGTSVQNNDANIVNIYSNDKDAYVATPANRTGDVKIMNMLGQEVKTGKIVDVLTKFTLSEPGIYVVQATVNGKTYTKKVIIR
jgi:hypothetical protein